MKKNSPLNSTKTALKIIKSFWRCWFVLELQHGWSYYLTCNWKLDGSESFIVKTTLAKNISRPVKYPPKFVYNIFLVRFAKIFQELLDIYLLHTHSVPCILIFLFKFYQFYLGNVQKWRLQYFMKLFSLKLRYLGNIPPGIKIIETLVKYFGNRWHGGSGQSLGRI